MKTQIMKKPLVAAVAACALGAASLPAFAADDAMMKRMEMLEQELKALKAQMQKQEAQATTAAPTVKVKNGGSLTFGGYLKADYRQVNGEVGYQDYWRGNNPGATDTRHTGFNVKESRLNMKYNKGDVTAFVEMDFYGSNGNEVATNSTNPRLRHAFIKTGNWMVGQYWTAFTPIKAFPEALDFGGPIVGEVFVRQPQIRYTTGNWTFSVENPETWGDGDVGTNTSGGGQLAAGADVDESTPDFVAAYNFKGDWGEVHVAGLLRQVDIEDGTTPGAQGVDETAVALNVGGRINVGERDDFRFQVNVGESGRYVGAGMINDAVVDTDGDYSVEETQAFTMAYRHFWNNDWRSTVYYGEAETDVADAERSHWGINLIRQLSPGLTAGVEIGQFEVDDKNGVHADSDYVQLSWKYAL